MCLGSTEKQVRFTPFDQCIFTRSLIFRTKVARNRPKGVGFTPFWSNIYARITPFGSDLAKTDLRWRLTSEQGGCTVCAVTKKGTPR